MDSGLTVARLKKHINVHIRHSAEAKARLLEPKSRVSPEVRVSWRCSKAKVSEIMNPSKDLATQFA